VSDKELLGDVDGERPGAATIKVTGSGWADRALLRGERVAITVIGEVTGISFKTQNGVLVRTHTVKAESMAEATGQLGDDVTEFLRRLEDEREGRLPLPLDGEGDGEAETDETGDSPE
jgi:hypothetical protein